MSKPWRVVRVAYFTPDKGRLIVEALSPLLVELKAGYAVEEAFVRCHWRLGPHVDLVLRCEAAVFEHQVFARCVSRIGSWLSQHPSTTQLDPAAYLALSRRLALFELEPGPYEPLLANNSVLAADYDDQRVVLGSQAMAAAREQFLVATTPQVLGLAATRLASPDEAMLEVARMLALTGAFYADQGLAGGYMSFRSHAEYFFANHDPAGRARERFDKTDTAVGPALDDIVRRVGQRHHARDLRDAFPESVAWIDVLEATHKAVRKVVNAHEVEYAREGRLDAVAERIVADLGVELDPAQARAASDFEVSAPDLPRLFADPAFNTYRTLVNFTYSLLPVAGISPIQKYLVCHLLSNACERVYGLHWRDIHDQERRSLLEGVAQ